MAELNDSFPNGLRSRSRDSDYDDERPRTVVVTHGEYETLLEQQEVVQANKPNTYRNRIVSVVAVALVMTGGAVLVASSRGSAVSSSSSSVTNLAKASAAAAPQQDKLPMKGDRVETPKVAVVEKKGDVKTEKKESSKDEKKGADMKKDVDPREEIDGAKAKKTAKPTVKPTTPPKPTVPPTTKKPSEKKDVQREEAPKGKAPPARSLAEKGNPSPEANPTSGRQEVAHKSAAVPVEKKGDVKEAPKEEKKDVDPREEIDGAKAKKTSKPTVKPTTPPKPTVPPTTKKPSEKKDVQREEAPKGKAPPARSLAELGNPTPKSNPSVTTTSSQAARAEGPKGAAVPVEKKGDVKEGEEKKDVDPREEVDGAKAKKTSKPTVKPTTPPKPTVPPTTKKPSEKKDVNTETEKVEGPKLHPASRMLSEVRSKITPSSSSVRGKGKTEKPVEGPPAPHAEPKGPRVLAEVRGKVTPSSSSVRGSKGKTEKPVEGPPAPHAEPKGPRALSAVPVTKDDADPCHDGLSPRCTPPTSKPVEHRSLAGTPTKSPSSGLHKPTWKPSSKPVEHATKSAIGAALPRKLKSANQVHKKEGDTDDATPPPPPPANDDASPPPPPVVDPVPTWEPSAKPVESPPDATDDTPADEAKMTSVNSNRDAGPKGAKKTLAHDGVPSRRLAGSPTKSPSSGLHKPTWKPSSKPVEHATKSAIGAALPRKLKSANQVHKKEGDTDDATPPPPPPANDDASPPPPPVVDPVPTWEPSAKPVESPPDATDDTPADEAKMTSVNSNRDAGPKGAKKTLAHDGVPSRRLAGSPTKSPSSGLHKPTWKPSSKPAEHRGLQKKDDADPCHDGLSPRCTPPTSKPVEHRSLAGSPTKSPSSGLHKPTWKPSSKPAEHRQ